jgi:hypothetical protein
MTNNETQADLVGKAIGYQAEESTHKVLIPGIDSLHTKPTSTIAETLALILKSEANVVEIRYRVGKFIELTTTRS